MHASNIFYINDKEKTKGKNLPALVSPIAMNPATNRILKN